MNGAKKEEPRKKQPKDFLSAYHAELKQNVERVALLQVTWKSQQLDEPSLQKVVPKIINQPHYEHRS
jgi:hypothetical protein